MSVESLTLLLRDEAFLVNVSLRLGLYVQEPSPVLQRSHDRRLRLAQLVLPRVYTLVLPPKSRTVAVLSDMAYRTLVESGVVALIEPRSLDREDGRRPDGINAFPFRQGKMLMWDTTYVNTFSSTKIFNCATAVEAAAIASEERKGQLYEIFPLRYDSSPLAL